MKIYSISQKVNSIIFSNKLNAIHPKTGKAISPFGHELNSTQGAIDLAFLNATPETTLQDVLFAGIDKEVSINRTEYCQDAHKKVGHTLNGHYARKAIEKGQGKLTYLGSSRESGQKSFRNNFMLCGGTAEQWQKVHTVCAAFNSEAKALGKSLKALCPPERHCTETNEVRISIMDLRKLAYKNSEIDAAWKAIEVPESVPSIDEVWKSLE